MVVSFFKINILNSLGQTVLWVFFVNAPVVRILGIGQRVAIEHLRQLIRPVADHVAPTLHVAVLLDDFGRHDKSNVVEFRVAKRGHIGRLLYNRT